MSILNFSTKLGEGKYYGSRVDGPISVIGFRHSPHCCSWKRFDKGVGVIEFQTHAKAQYVTIAATETTEGGKSSKDTHMTLDRDEAIMLRRWLDEFIGKAI